MRNNKYVADLNALGSLIRERRRELGLTQTELGARLGWVQERISLLEHGKYGTPSLPLLASLAAALEIAQADVLRAAGFLDGELSKIPVAANGRIQPAREQRIPVTVSGGRLSRENDALQQGMTRLQDQLVLAEQRVHSVETLCDQLVSQRRHMAALMTRLHAAQSSDAV